MQQKKSQKRKRYEEDDPTQSNARSNDADSFSSVGKDELKQQVELGKEPAIDLGTLYISDGATMLKGVEVVAQKPLVKMEVDKMTR